LDRYREALDAYFKALREVAVFAGDQKAAALVAATRAVDAAQAADKAPS
jgi:hypothetical protein